MRRLRSMLGADLLPGLFLIGLGLFAILEASSYALGSFRRMGPGLFPLMLGIGLVLCGLGVLLTQPGPADLRPVLQKLRTAFPVVSVIVLAVLIFIWSYRFFGLVAAIIALTVVSAAVQRPFRPINALLTGIVLAAFSTGVFVMLFGIPLVPFRWPF